VSDPFGTDDISSVSISIVNPAGGQVAGTMTALSDTDTSDGSREYEFDFPVPENPPLGGWTAKITAKEGVEDLVDDFANIPFAVQGLVTLGKTWSEDAHSGDTVNLAITGATTDTAGTSAVDGSTVAATAMAAGGATLTLAEEFTSGSAGNYTISLVCTRAKDAATVTVSGTGVSRTIVMPADSAVNCTWNNAKSVPLTVVKTSVVVSDPTNGADNPKAIPGAIVKYTITVLNPGADVDADTLVLADYPLPDQVALLVADIAGSGSGPVAFHAGTSGMTYQFAALDDDGDDIDFTQTPSTNPPPSWDYHPTIHADGVDAGVTGLRISPSGVFTSGGQFDLEFLVRIK
jgi:hypothetical protein